MAECTGRNCPAQVGYDVKNCKNKDCPCRTEAPTVEYIPPTAECKWCQDEICVNADCPMRADYCPVVDNPGVCRYEEREEQG